MWAIAFKENIAFYLYLRFSVITSIKVLLSFMALLFSVIYKTMLLLDPSVMSDSVTPWTSACQASLSFTNSQSLLKLRTVESVMPSDHLTLCRPPLLLPLIFPSIRVFSNESTLHIRWPKFCSF